MYVGKIINLIEESFPFLFGVGRSEGIDIEHLKNEAIASYFGGEYPASIVFPNIAKL